MGAGLAKRWQRRIFWSLLALLGFLSLCIAWLFTTDLGAFKPQLEEFVTERIGREFSINGELDIHLGHSLEFTAENIFLENADWADEPAMVDVGRLSVAVNLRSIFSGPIIVELIDIDDMTLNLVKRANNDNNWTFELAGGKDKPTAEEKPAARKKPLDLLPLALNIDNVRIVYEDAHRPEPIDIQIQSWRQLHRVDDTLEASFVATINDQDIDLQTKWSTWTSLLASRHVEFDMTGHLGTISVRAKGLIDDLRKPSRPVVDFNIAGPSVTHLSAVLGLGEIGEGDVNLAGSLSAEKDSPLILGLKGNLGQTLVDATGSAAAIDKLENIDLAVAASGPSLGRVLSYFGINQVGNEPFEIALGLQRTGTALSIENTRLTFGDSLLQANGELLNFPAFNDATVSIEVTGQRMEHLRHLLDLPGIATGPFSARLDVKADEFGKPAVQATVQTSLARIVARGGIGDPPNYLGSHFDFELDAPSLQQLGRFVRIERRLPDQPVSASGSLVRQDKRLELDKPMRVRTEGIAASILGTVQLKPRLLGTTLQIEVDGVDLRDALRRFGVDVGLPPLPYEVSGAARFGANGIELQGVAAELGTSAIELEGLLAITRGLSGTRLKISSSGPSMEELFSGLDNFDVFPGAFESTATLRFSDTEIRVDKFRLERERGQAALDATIGLPFSTNRLELDLDASGHDIRSLFSELGGFEPESAPFRMKAQVERDDSEWSFQPLQVSLGTATIEARGQLTLEQQAISGSVKIVAEVPDVASHGRYQGKIPRPMPLHLSATLSGDGDRLVIDDLLANFGESSVSGQIAYRQAAVPEVELSLRSESLAAMPIFEAATTESDPVPADEDGRVIPATRIPFALLRRVNGVFSIEVGDIRRNNFHAENVRVHGTLRDGTLGVDTLNLETRGGNIATSGTLVAYETGGQARLKLTANNLAVTNLSDHPVRADVNFDVLAEGADLRELAANSNGFFVLQATDGILKKNAMLATIYGGFAGELLAAMNPFSKSSDTAKLECGVVAIEIVDGLIRGSPAAYFQTDNVRVLANAVVDLETEKIKMGFESLPRKGVSMPSVGEVMNPYFGVEGTFSAPQIKLDEKSAIVAGSAAVATAGLSILAKGLWARMKGSSDACKKAAAIAEETIEAYANQDDP